MKPILLLDFDGVCHSFTSGWCGPAIIPDPPVEGLYEFLEEAGRVFEIHIWSTRNSYPEGIRAMQEWLRKGANGQALPEIQFPTDKPPAHITIDDRAVTFQGVWPDVQELQDFRPWNKRDDR